MSRLIIRQLIIYSVPLLGVIAAFGIIHVMVRPITGQFLVYVAILSAAALAIGYVIDMWLRGD